MTSLLAICLCLYAPATEERPCVVVAVGAPGAPEYDGLFTHWADLWQAAAAKAGAECLRIGTTADGETPDRERLRTILAQRGTAGLQPLWIVFLGHGTFDGREAKFNLRGPDVSDVEFASWMAQVKRPVVFINCASSSGPFLNRLSSENRTVVTSTRSGHEQNFARFGQYLSEAIADPRSDLDKDGQVSLLEAFLTASHNVEEYYKTKSQLATEHALLDDNGDHLGTPADWFRGVRAVRRAKDGAPLDGIRAHQIHLVQSDRERRIPLEVRRRRDQVELSIASLRDKKATLPEDQYYAQLETLMVELARIYRDLPAEADQARGHAH
jgi:hypothetical protein